MYLLQNIDNYMTAYEASGWIDNQGHLRPPPRCCQEYNYVKLLFNVY